MPKSDSGEGDWKGGEYLRNGPLELTERVHVQLFEKMDDVRGNKFRPHQVGDDQDVCGIVKDHRGSDAVIFWCLNILLRLSLIVTLMDIIIMILVGL